MDDIIQGGTTNLEINPDEAHSIDGDRLPLALKRRTSPYFQAPISTDTMKERSLSVTTQMFGQLQDGEIKRFLTGLGNIAKSCEQPMIKNTSIHQTSSFKERNSLVVPLASNTIPPRDTLNTESVNVDTILTSKDSKHLTGRSCPV